MLRCVSLLAVFILLTNPSIGQERSLSSYIQELEKETDYIFNYDVLCTDTIVSSFDLNKTYTIEQIRALFRHSPFDILVQDKQIIVLPLSKKELKLCGTIRSAYDNSILPFAHVLVGAEQGTQSNTQGVFAHNCLSYKNTVITIRYLGYEPLQLMAQELTTCGEVYLAIDEQLFNSEIIITDYLSKGITEGNAYNAFGLDIEKLLLGNAIIETDVFKKMQALPGIYSPEDSAVNLNIRGSSSDQNLINWEGLPLYDGGHFFGMVSAINPFHLAQVKVYKTVHSATFDNRIGGIIDIKLPAEIDNQYRLSLGTTLTESHLNAAIPLIKNKLQWLIAGRRSNYEILENNPTFSSYANKVFQTESLTNGEGSEASEEQELIMKYYDINTKLIFKPHEKLKVQSSFLNSSDQSKYVAMLNQNQIESTDTLSTATLAFANRISYGHSNRDTTELHVGYSKHTFSSYLKLRAAATNQNYSEKETENKISDFQIKLIHKKRIDRHELQLGYIHDRKAIETEYEDLAAYEIDQENEANETGNYHHLSIDDNLAYKDLSVQVGLRTSYAEKQASIDISPRMAVRYRLTKELNLKASLGKFHQYLSKLYETTDSHLNLTSDIWTIDTLSTASPLRSNKISVGAIFDNTQWTIDLEGYLFQNTGLSAENPHIRNSIVIDRQGETISKGIDMVISRKYKRFRSTLYYSLSDQKVYFPFANDEEEKVYFPANTDQLQVLEWTNSLLLNKLSISGSYKYRTGLPFSSPSDVIQRDEDGDEEDYEILTDGVNNSRLIDYHRLDLGLQYLYTKGKYKVEAGISVLNMLNRKNLLSSKYFLANTDESSNEPEVLQVQKNQLGRTLQMHCRVYF